MTENWLQKYKDLAEKSTGGRDTPTEAHKQAQESGKNHNEDLRKQQVQHRRAAFESATPRDLQVSGKLGRPAITETGPDGKVVTHIKGIDSPGATTDSAEQTKTAERKLVDLGDGVKAEEVTPANCSDSTKKLWEAMSSPAYKGAAYNCFCAVIEYVQPGNWPSPNHIPGEVRLVLKAHGWKEHKEMDLDSGGHKAGEVVMITDADKHTHAAIVSKVENGHIVELEQKPNDTDPPIKTSLKQFKELFKPAHAEIYQKDS